MLCALRFVENIYRAASRVCSVRSCKACSAAVWSPRALSAPSPCWLRSRPPWKGFVWQVVISIITIPLLASVVYRELPRCPRPARFSWDSVMGIWRFAGGVMTITLFSLLLTQSEKILLSRLLPLNVFAIYAVAGVFSSALYMLSTPIGAAFYPSFTQRVTMSDMAALRLAYHQAAQLSDGRDGQRGDRMMIFADTVLSVDSKCSVDADARRY